MLNQAAVEALYSAAYLDDYMDSIEFLPDELQRNVSQMRELDVKYQALLREMDQHLDLFLTETEQATRRRNLLHIHRALIKTQEIGDEKLQIMSQVIDMIDNKARQLEMDYQSLDVGKPEEKQEVTNKQQQQAQQQNNQQQEECSQTQKEKPGTKRSRRRNYDSISRDSIPEPEPEKRRQKKKKRKTKTDKEKTPDSPLGEAIDPNEPTYCLCEQVSYGEMIGCDNEQCPIEWFHFSCVRLTTKPKGKWFCPKCRGDNSKTCRFK